MKYKAYIVFICVILIFVGTLTIVSAEENQTILKDDFSDLQTEIDQTPDKGVVELEKNYTIEGAVELDKNIKITKDITIEGKNKTTIKNQLSIINVNQSNLVLKDLTLDDTAILATNSKISLINCTMKNFDGYSTYFINSTSYTLHGGIELRNSSVEVIGSTICDGAKPFESRGDISIIDSIFTNIGVLQIYSDNAKIINTSFTNVDIISNVENLDLRKSRFINTTTYELFDGPNGREYHRNPMITITGSATVTNNTFMDNYCSNIIYANGEESKKENYITIMNNIIINEKEPNTGELDPYRCGNIHIKTALKEIHVIPENEWDDDYVYYTPITNITLANNFFGFNIEDTDEFYLNRQIIIETETYVYSRNGELNNIGLVTLNLEKANNQYILKFTDSSGNIVDMPEATFSLKDKKTGEIIASDITVKNGQGIFNLSKEIDLEDVYILDCLSYIVNKPKANITFGKTGEHYLDTQVIMYLKNGTLALGDEKVIMIFERSGQNYNDSLSYTVETQDNGSQICDGRAKNGGYIYYPVIAEPAISDINLTVKYASREFGLTKASFSFHLDYVDAELTLKPSSRTYDPNPKKYTSIEIEGIKLTYNNYGTDYEPEMTYKLYKDGKLLYETEILHLKNKYMIWDSGLPKLSVGTYKVVISMHKDSVYKFASKTTTLKITKAKPTVNAPKVSAKYKKSKYFKVTLKYNKKALQKVKLKIKVYTGKKYKTYTVKTNKKGTAQINTKSLKKGKHKVVISSGDANYQISKKSQITIKK